ncbi:MAG: nucleotide exchange factor GrpE [Alcaligenaceae bacterium]|jgi:molecular chaperone GrpE
MADPKDSTEAHHEHDPASVTPEEGAPKAEDSAPLDPIEQLRAELAAAQTQLAEQRDQALRAHAEMENVRRRAQEEVSKARKFGIESFAEGLVPVKDSLEAALAQTEQTAETMRTGIEVTLKQLASAFERNHLKEIAPEAGAKFDPHQHQAIATIPAEQAANTVVQTLQKGYLIADRVLRPALVTVAA